MRNAFSGVTRAAPRESNAMRGLWGIVASVSVALGMLGCAAPGPKAPPVDPTVTLAYPGGDLPRIDRTNEQLYVLFDDSPKTSVRLAEVLRQRGYAVVNTIGESEVAYKLSGRYRVYGKARAGVSGFLGKYLEKTIDTQAWTRGAADVHANMHLEEILISRKFFPSATQTFAAQGVGDVIGIVARPHLPTVGEMDFPHRLLRLPLGVGT